MSCGNKLFLHKTVRVSKTSVFFLPKEETELDFQTVSDTPKAHRAHLQKNGLVAKVMLSMSTSTVSLTSTERLTIWWKVMLNCGVVEADTASVVLPFTLSAEQWPILEEESFAKHMDVAVKLHKNERLKACSSIVPILSVQQFICDTDGIKASLGIIWMPYYKHNLQQWCKKGLFVQFIPETTLVKLAKQLIIAFMVLRLDFWKGVLYFGVENILVAEENNKEPRFLLIASVDSFFFPWKELLKADQSLLSLFPFIAPEVVQQMEKSVDGAKCDVWCLGIILYQLACGGCVCSSFSGNGLLKITNNAATLLHRYNNIKQRLELPLNHPLVNPSDVVRRVQRDLQRRSYSTIFIHFVLLMLGQDPVTRPTFCLLDQMLLELFRHNPILRFPFAVGSLDLVRLPNPKKVLIIPGKERYVFKSLCLETKENHVGGEQIPAACSPFWSGDELLPAYSSFGVNRMSYLFPLIGKLGSKEQRHYIEVALKSEPINKVILLQLFGGFAVVAVEGNDMITSEVLIPLPKNVICDKEKSDSFVTRLSFTAALPWPSECTGKLKQSGRIHFCVPAIFGLHNAYGYAWILPGESFELNGSEWIPAINGAFVFWFNEDLQPSELDRYFLLCDCRSMKAATHIECTIFPDQSFNKKRNEEDKLINLDRFQTTPMISFSEGKENKGKTFTALRKRKAQPCVRNVFFANVPIEATEENNVSDEVGFEGSNFFLVKGGNITNNDDRKKRSDFLWDDAGLYKKNVEGVLPITQEKGTKFSLKEESCLSQLNENVMPLAAIGKKTNKLKKQEFACKNNKKTDYQLLEMVKGGFSAPETKTLKQHTSYEKSDTQKIQWPKYSSKMSHFSSQQSQLTEKRLLFQVFGRWCHAGCIDAVYRSLTFCIPETGEHGRLSAPVKVTEAVAVATRAPGCAVRMAFCANNVPTLRRNHQRCALALPSTGAKEIIPHHALVFYDCNKNVVALLALRFAGASCAGCSQDEFRLKCKTMPPVSAGSVMAEQINAVYFFSDEWCERPSSCLLVDSEEDVLACPRSDADADVCSASTISTDRQLTFSGTGLISFQGPAPRVRCGKEGNLPLCWVGFDTATSMLMLSDVRREMWHPTYFF